MSVLVTGGAGYIGGHMTLGLIDAGETVVVLDNLSTGFAWAVPDGASWWSATPATPTWSRRSAEHRVDAIAHFAAKIVVPESVGDPLGYYLNNTVKRATPDRNGDPGRRQAFHLLFDRGGLRRDLGRTGGRGRAAQCRSRPTAGRS